MDRGRNRRRLHLAPVVLAALVTPLAGCGGRPVALGRPRTVRLDGAVRAADGSVPPAVHVAIRRPAGGGDIPVRTGPQGTFTAEIPLREPVLIAAAAPFHEEAEVPAVFRSGGTASVTVRLRPNPLPERLADVRIIGDFNDFDFSTAEPMERRDDGTWYWRREGVTQDPFRYQLLGVTATGRSVNGTRSDAYEYDGGGDFRSLVHPEDGVVEIVFDPKLLPRAGGGDLPSVTWDPAHAELEPCLAAYRTVRERTEAMLAAFTRHREEGLPEEEFSFDDTPYRRRLERLAEEAAGPLAGEMARLALFALDRHEAGEPDPGTVRELIRRVPPSSLAWGFFPDQVQRLLYLAGEDLGVRLGRRFRFESAIAGVRTEALAYLVALARSHDDAARWRRLYAILKREAGDTPRWRYELAYLDPDARIRPGRKLPAFSVTLLDGTPLTDRDLRGRWVLLDFWATWCGPCRAEVPYLERAWERFHGRGLEIVSLSFDRSEKDIEAFRQEHPMPWRHALVEGGFRSELASTFEVLGVPKPILIRPDGTIAATEEHLRGEKLLETLARHLGAPAEPATGAPG